MESLQGSLRLKLRQIPANGDCGGPRELNQFINSSRTSQDRSSDRFESIRSLHLIILAPNVQHMTTSETTRSLRPVIGASLMFFTNGAIFASLLPWYPLIAGGIGLTELQFGFAVAAFPAGAIVSSSVPVPLIRRFGPLPVAVVGTVLVAVGVTTASWASSSLMLAACLFVAGFADAVVDVGQNIAGIRIQDNQRRPIFSSMHALWSLGGATAGAVATAVAVRHGSIHAHMIAASIVCVALVLLGAVLVGRAAPTPAAQPVQVADRPTSTKWKSLLIVLPLAFIAMAGSMVEDVANNWAAMSAVTLGGISAASAGIAFTVVIASQCVGRFSGDYLIFRFGRGPVARFGGILIAVGGILVVTSQFSAMLLIGLALAGYGSATLVPSALSQAAHVPGVSESTGVTMVSWLLRAGFLLTSPLIGILTTAFSLRVGLSLLVISGLAAMLLARYLGGKPQPIE